MSSETYFNFYKFSGRLQDTKQTLNWLVQRIMTRLIACVPSGGSVF